MPRAVMRPRGGRAQARPETAQVPVRVGFFGKLPSRGDFVRAGLSRAMVAAWDGWLQAVLPEAEHLAGATWAGSWRAAPCWRFRLPAGLCGPQAWTGLWLASSDLVGRCFPLLAAAETACVAEMRLDEIERACRAAIAAGDAPDGLAARLQAALGAALAPEPGARHLLTPPDPNASVAAPHWWQAGEEPIMISTGMPDARQFLRMLAAP